jgi:hypothetical protein
MANKPDERLIILLPPDLLEQVRRAAEAEDLSVSQIVRRALRNELKAIAEKVDFNLGKTLEDLQTLLVRHEGSVHGILSGESTKGTLTEPIKTQEQDDSPKGVLTEDPVTKGILSEADRIARKKRRKKRFKI